MNDAILVVASEQEYATTMSGITFRFIMAARADSHSDSAAPFMAVATTQSMRRLLRSRKVNDLPSLVKDARRKLLVGFDTEASDLLERMATEIGRSQELSQWAEESRSLIMSVSQFIGGYTTTRDCPWEKVWVQEPLFGSFDGRLAEKLTQRGVEVFRMSDNEERFASVYAANAVIHAQNQSPDGVIDMAVHDFWDTLKNGLNGSGVQAILLNSGTSVLEKQQDKTLALPEVHNITELYMRAIVTWALGDY